MGASMLIITVSLTLLVFTIFSISELIEIKKDRLKFEKCKTFGHSFGSIGTRIISGLNVRTCEMCGWIDFPSQQVITNYLADTIPRG